MSNQLVKFETSTGLVELTHDTVKRYLVSGDADKVTDQEVQLFIELCKYRKLNPFLKEAYLIKFGNSAASLVVSYDVFKARAEANPHYKGHEAGVIVLSTNGEVVYRVGALRLPGEQVVGGYCEVYRDDYSKPIRVEVSFEEYAQTKSDGKLNRQWATKPAFMIRKVALAQGLREAFPNDFDGLYIEEENVPITNNVEVSSDDAEVEVIETVTKDDLINLVKLAKHGVDMDNAKNIICQATAETGLRDIGTPYDELNLSTLTKDEYEQLMDKVNEIKSRQ